MVNIVVVRSGVRLGGDSGRYINGGHDLFGLRALHDKAASYLGYVLVVGGLHVGLWAVVAFQVVAQGAAAVGIYRLADRVVSKEGAVLAAALYVGSVDIARWNAYILTDSLYTSVLVAVVVGLAAGTENETPDASLVRGDVLWHSPAWQLSMPPPSDPAAHGWNAVVGYAAHHPLPVLKIAFARVLAELAHVRPYYSTLHNLLIAVWLVPLYLFAGLGLWVYRRERTVRIVAVVVVLHLVAVAATFADYDGRFMTYLLPLVGIGAAAGVVCAWDRVSQGGRAPCR